MKLHYRAWLWLGVLAGLLAVGCKPRTMSEKIEDKAEDVGHEIKQGTERTGERVKDATN